MRHGQLVVHFPAATGRSGSASRFWASSRLTSKPLAANLVLETHDAFQQRFGPRRAAGNINMNRDDQIYAANNVVAVFKVGASGRRTGAHTRSRIFGSAICS